MTADPPETKLLDFGLAKLTTAPEGSNFTRSGQPLGTPAYMAPEQVFGEAGRRPARRRLGVRSAALRMSRGQTTRRGERPRSGGLERSSEGRVSSFEALPDLPPRRAAAARRACSSSIGTGARATCRRCARCLAPRQRTELASVAVIRPGRGDPTPPHGWIAAAALAVTASLAFVIRDASAPAPRRRLPKSRRRAPPRLGCRGRSGAASGRSDERASASPSAETRSSRPVVRVSSAPRSAARSMANPYCTRPAPRAPARP